MEPNSIPAALATLSAALRGDVRGPAVTALREARAAGATLDAAAERLLERLLERGGGVLRGSRFGRVIEVIDAALVLADAVGDPSGWDALAAATDMLVVATPPAPSTATSEVPPRPGWPSSWAGRTEDWGRPAITAGAAHRLSARIPGPPLREAVERSFPRPRPRSPLAADWIDDSPDGVVLAAAAVLIARPGFREIAALLVGRGAWAAAAGLVEARSFVEETRRLRLGRAIPTLPDHPADRAAFLDALRDAARREAVHSFGVVHASAAACAELESRGSPPVARAARHALEALRPTWSAGVPPGV